MGVQCCKQSDDQPQELSNQISNKEPLKLSNTPESQTITKELFESKGQKEFDILYIKDPFQIQGDSQFICKIAGDIDELDVLQHSLRSLDSCSLPDDTNTKKTILKRELHYISKGKVQINNKKKVRFDLHRKS